MKLKIQIIVLLVSVLAVSCYQTERNCKDFKIGSFETVVEINGKKEKAIFTRNDSLEITTFHQKTDTASIRWINDCECVLQKLHPKNMAEQKAVHIKILTTQNNTYNYEFSIVGNSSKQKGIVTKIK
jgi:hypothetical protein